MLGGGWYFLHGHKPEATMQIYKETLSSYPGDFFSPFHSEGSRHWHKKHQGKGLGLWGWTALKWQTQETVWFFFPPKPLSEKWGYGKNCPEERGNARTSRRLSVVCVWLKRILGLSAWT